MFLFCSRLCPAREQKKIICAGLTQHWCWTGAGCRIGAGQVSGARWVLEVLEGAVSRSRYW